MVTSRKCHLTIEKAFTHRGRRFIRFYCDIHVIHIMDAAEIRKLVTAKKKPMIQIDTPRLISITEANFHEVLDEYQLKMGPAASALSFAFHYKKLLFYDIDEGVFLWRQTPMGARDGSGT
jgi:hypothetical protein